MKMIWHDTKPKHGHVYMVRGLDYNFHEFPEVLIIKKYSVACVGPVDNVITDTAPGLSRGSRHIYTPINCKQGKKGTVPIFSFMYYVDYGAPRD